MKHTLLALQYDDLCEKEWEQAILRMLKSKRVHAVYTPNAMIAYRCFKDPSFFRLIGRGSYIVPDGEGVILGGVLAGNRFRHGKHAGVDMGETIARLCAQIGAPLFLYGGRRGVAKRAASRLFARYPGLRIAGTMHGYGNDPEAVAETIRKSGARAVFVCLGSPAQERFIDRYGDRTGASLLAGLGGSLDVYAGDIKRAPQAWIDARAEWLWRLMDDPRRLFGMATIPLYLTFCVCERFDRRRDGKEDK